MPPHYGGMSISKTPYSAPLVAILNANPVSGERLAVLDAQLTSQGDDWYQLLPVGPFKARDGRPFDVTIPRAIITLGSDDGQGRRPTVSGSAVAIKASVRGWFGKALRVSNWHRALPIRWCVTWWRPAPRVWWGWPRPCPSALRPSSCRCLPIRV